MELKLQKPSFLDKVHNLLIVPYGIETSQCNRGTDILVILLIVPYGIETEERTIETYKAETFNRTLWN